MWTELPEPEVGAIAWHVTNFVDPRKVAKVEGDQVWLDIGFGKIIGPFPKKNYTYEKAVS